MPTDDDGLESWKEIATYLKRDVTTVQRWEKREGLPVHRHLHDKSGSVYALRSELDRWRRARSRAPDADVSPDSPSDDPDPRPAIPLPLSPRSAPTPRGAARAAVLSAIGLGALALTIAALRPDPSPEASQPVAFTVASDPATTLSPNEPPLIAPDGRTLAFIALGADGVARLYARAIDDTVVRVLPGTEGARHAFWSPDSRQLAFFAEGRLMALALNGGEPRAICEAPFGQAGAWNEDGVILFPRAAQGGLFRVRMEGGAVTRVTEPQSAAGDFAHRAPHFLPGGRRFLFLVRSTRPDREGIYVASLDGGGPRPVLRSLSEAWYASGHLLFVQPPALMAVKVHTGTLALDGAPLALTRQASHDSASGRGLFSVSEGGTVAFSAMRTPAMRLVTVDREGVRRNTPVAPGVFWDLARAPGGSTLALTRLEPGVSGRDIWEIDLTTSQSRRVTSDVADDAMPVWAPDGRQLAFSSRRLGTYDIFVRPAEAGPAVPVVVGDGDQWINDWSHDGRLLLYSSTTPGNTTRSDLFVYDRVTGASATLVRSSGRDTQARFSPDGRWVAYACDEAGQPEVFVMPYPAVDRPHTVVSVGGGGYPRWRSDGKELYYVDSTGSLVAARIDLTSSAKVGALQVVARGALASLGPTISGLGADYSPSDDGATFLIKEPTEAVAGPITVVVNGIGRRLP